MDITKRIIRLYPSTFYLLLIQLLIYAIVSIPTPVGKYFSYLLAGANWLILDGQIWRLITPIFLQVTWSHLFYNLALLLLIGTFLENYWGSRFVAFQFIMTGICANIFTLFVTNKLFVHYGSSSATAGLLGCIIYLLFAEHKHFPTYLFPLVFIALSLNVVTSIASMQINIYGHLFGLFSGILFSFLFHTLKKEQNL